MDHTENPPWVMLESERPHMAYAHHMNAGQRIQILSDRLDCLSAWELRELAAVMLIEARRRTE